MAAQRKRKRSWVKLKTTAVPNVESCSWFCREISKGILGTVSDTNTHKHKYTHTCTNIGQVEDHSVA